jgi:hypothetical protein
MGMLLDSHLYNVRQTYTSIVLIVYLKIASDWLRETQLDQSTLATIIDTLVMSKINYCSTVWSVIRQIATSKRSN